ncbi:hypothetical protein [Alloactinosynnema sp. L-07]|uniref:hypothetical protein n=1 Tax=Alloactinosynnema sp. L-07 TaxID=1653480 RepID=UPI00065F0212|nr:hypothetical protein [Alloactinosynnema sp. L-07]CRK59909.1 hypothetical protein [Alloactinosynnema sp. L-07]
MKRIVLAHSAADIPAVARALRDAGAEVIFVAPDQVVSTALQEDADAVAVDTNVGAVVAGLAERDAEDIPVLTYDQVIEWVAGRYQ